MDAFNPNDTNEISSPDQSSPSGSMQSGRDSSRGKSPPSCSKDLIQLKSDVDLPGRDSPAPDLKDIRRLSRVTLTENAPSSGLPDSSRDFSIGYAASCSRNIGLSSIESHPLAEELPSCSRKSGTDLSSSGSKDLVQKRVAQVVPVARKYEEIVGPEADASVACTLAFIRKHSRGTDDVSSIQFSQFIAKEPTPCSVVVLGGEQEQESQNGVLEQFQATVCSPSVPPVVTHTNMNVVSFVLPMVVKLPLGRYLKLIQNQNEGLKTDKWCVAKQTVLDPESADYDLNVVFRDVENRATVTYVDEESEVFLRKEGQVKFMFWRLRINFSPSL
ncbi:uncharacterized protein LOC108028080 [Drosophila biarmipes]|uniref:uncharacterized protein LOC108028080 n=1 Tax=Drosophila biarmipes TaxID=125945 RepID=UPI0007E74F19|nr:uncharacterized protein LOC108028080 [Drosophila biarmipes]